MMIENGFFPHFEERVKKKERRRKKNVFSNLFILSIIVCAVVNIDIIDDHFDVRDGFVDVVRFDVRLDAHDDFVDVVY